MLKIIAGEYRSRRLAVPPGGEATRPFLGRVRESVFDLLRGWFQEARVVDLFAGVGTMGLEAVSRGAATVLMVESHPETFTLLQENIQTLGCANRATALQEDALGEAWLDHAPRPVDVLFVDPPYAMMRDERSRAAVLRRVADCRPIMAERGWVVLRTPFGPEGIDLHIEQFEGPEVHRYRPDMCVHLYGTAGGASRGDPSGPTAEEGGEA